MADRPHDPAVEPAQRLLGHRRQRMAVRLVAGLADRQRLPVDREAGARGRRLHHLDAFRDDFEPDVVAEQNSDLQRRSPPLRSTRRAAHSSMTMFASVEIPPPGRHLVPQPGLARRRATPGRGATMPPLWNASCISGACRRLDEGLVQRLDDLRRHAGRREGGHPLRRAHAGEADLRDGRNVRDTAASRCGGRDRERAHVAGLHHADRIGDVEPRHLDVAVGEVA